MNRKKLEVFKTLIPGCVKIRYPQHIDARGVFQETWNLADYHEAGLPVVWWQDNMSISFKNVLRGLHFQKGKEQGKLIRCFAGSIWDVCVDLRPGSPTFGMWEGCHLSWENPLGFYVPPGCAHGFVVTAESAMVHYKCTDVYDPMFDAGIFWQCPDLRIEWPLAPGAEVVISPKDQQLPKFREYAQSIGVTL